MLEAARIDITSRLRPPALLSVSMQTRDETLRLWYTTNTFQLDVYDLDAKLVNVWAHHITAVGLMVENVGQIQIKVQDSYHWDNLVAWTRVIWEDQPSYKVGLVTGASRTEAVFHGAAHISCDYQGCTWATCLAALEKFRQVLSRFDGQWKKAWEVL